MTDIEEVFYGLIQYINEDVSCKDHILYIIFDTTKPQPNHKVTPTHTEPDTTHEVTLRIIRKLLRMDVLTSETC